MKADRHTAADQTWVEKADDSGSIVGAIIALIVIAFPLMLL